MFKTLTLADISQKIAKKIYTQNYAPLITIKDVLMLPLTNHISEEGDFGEIMRIGKDGNVENIPDFQINQINRTKLFPGSIKAWHLHFAQDEIWYISPEDTIFVGLWDIRQKSPTHNVKQRIVLGGGNSSLLFIPRGVAHGSANFSGRSVELFYFVNQKFNPATPDEKRIPWDFLGKEFWTPARD